MHPWLTVVLDDFLDRLDPVGIVWGRIAPHEYLPEIPDLLLLLTSDTITYENVQKVFAHYFGQGHVNHEKTERIVKFLTQTRERWLVVTTSEDEETVNHSNTEEFSSTEITPEEWIDAGKAFRKLRVRCVISGELYGIEASDPVAYSAPFYEEVKVSSMGEAIEKLINRDWEWYEAHEYG
jgi:hypothetical protein